MTLNLEILIRLKLRYLNSLKPTITQNACPLPWAINLLKTLKNIPLILLTKYPFLLDNSTPEARF